MSKVEKIVETVEKESPGLLDSISQEDGVTKKDLVRKVLALSRGQMVRTHQNPALLQTSKSIMTFVANYSGR